MGKTPLCLYSVLYAHNVHLNYELSIIPTFDCYRQLMIPYLSATTGAVGTALVLNKVAKVRHGRGRVCVDVSFHRETHWSHSGSQLASIMTVNQYDNTVRCSDHAAVMCIGYSWNWASPTAHYSCCVIKTNSLLLLCSHFPPSLDAGSLLLPWQQPIASTFLSWDRSEIRAQQTNALSSALTSVSVLSLSFFPRLCVGRWKMGSKWLTRTKQ